MANTGTFIVLEGADGSGKTTQFNLLRARLEAIGHSVDVYKFPQYDKESSYFIRKYLAGDYGNATELSPYTASLFFAMDRFEGAPAIKRSLAEGNVVLSDRYVGANMAHQGSKFENVAEQRGFFLWDDSLEFDLLGIPRPMITFFLKVPAEISQKLIEERASKTGTRVDDHEKSLDHLKKTVATYEQLCKLFPNDFKMVECTKEGKLLNIPEINNKIWELAQPLLPKNPAKPAHSVTVKLNEEVKLVNAKKSKAPTGITKSNDQLALTEKLSLLAYYEAMQAGLNISSSNMAWHKNNYEYYKPVNLPKNVLAKYDEAMGSIAKAYKAVKTKLGKDPNADKYLLAMTPLAALIQTLISAGTTSLHDTLKNLSVSETDEVMNLAEKLNALARKSDPRRSKVELAVFTSKGPEPINKILARLAAEHLPQNLPQEVEPVVLIEATPRNEFKVLADTIYSYSSLPKSEIENGIDDWSYQQKSEALESAVKSGADEILAKFRYQFDITADRLSLAKVLQSSLAEEIKVQPATPRFGYGVPEAIEQVGATDEFLDAFDKSLELFSGLQAADREDLAPYATLVGHKARFQLSCSLGNIATSLQAQNSPELTKLLNIIIEQIGARHPVAIAGLVKAQVNSSKTGKTVDLKTEPKKSSSRKSRSRNHRGGKPKKS